MDVASDALAITSIRRATRDRHADLESVLQLVSPLGRTRYLDALRGFDLFLSLWEPRVDAALPQALRSWFRAGSRHGLLRDDLARMGGAQAPPEDVASACRQALSGIDLHGAGAFGSLYVLEGSVLGGQVIAKLAADTLALDRSNGASYFHGLDDHPAARWAAFRTLLEAQVGSQPQARREACRAACQTFDALIVTFTALCREHAAA